MGRFSRRAMRAGLPSNTARAHSAPRGHESRVEFHPRQASPGAGSLCRFTGTGTPAPSRGHSRRSLGGSSTDLAPGPRTQDPDTGWSEARDLWTDPRSSHGAGRLPTAPQTHPSRCPQGRARRGLSDSCPYLKSDIGTCSKTRGTWKGSGILGSTVGPPDKSQLSWTAGAPQVGQETGALTKCSTAGRRLNRAKQTVPSGTAAWQGGHSSKDQKAVHSLALP